MKKTNKPKPYRLKIKKHKLMSLSLYSNNSTRISLVAVLDKINPKAFNKVNM